MIDRRGLFVILYRHAAELALFLAFRVETIGFGDRNRNGRLDFLFDLRTLALICLVKITLSARFLLALQILLLQQLTICSRLRDVGGLYLFLQGRHILLRTAVGMNVLFFYAEVICLLSGLSLSNIVLLFYLIRSWLLNLRLLLRLQLLIVN